MTNDLEKALQAIASLRDGEEYKALTKTELYEALKYARHIAKSALAAAYRQRVNA